ncbi:CDC45-like protein [Giardia muris]|uniref:CDC45-like protein n=1 Tax=Giardia muris TaxID=5742 RepID=A0A4Z1SYJ2_GIAMU|nr:CDC45-like protein [Giardia muris]|eukprot:TNJ29845.1 CDC45-like protein [Giardia muris]
MLIRHSRLGDLLEDAQLVTVLFALDVDALMAVALLRELLRINLHEFSFIPIRSLSELQTHLCMPHRSMCSHLYVTVNIGAQTPLSTLLQEAKLEKARSVVIIDSHRPAHISNVIADNVYLLDDGMIAGGLRLSFLTNTAKRVLSDRVTHILDRARRREQSYLNTTKDEGDPTSMSASVQEQPHHPHSFNEADSPEGSSDEQYEYTYTSETESDAPMDSNELRRPKSSRSTDSESKDLTFRPVSEFSESVNTKSDEEDERDSDDTLAQHPSIISDGSDHSIDLHTHRILARQRETQAEPIKPMKRRHRRVRRREHHPHVDLSTQSVLSQPQEQVTHRSLMNRMLKMENEQKLLEMARRAEDMTHFKDVLTFDCLCYDLTSQEFQSIRSQIELCQNEYLFELYNAMDDLTPSSFDKLHAHLTRLEGISPDAFERLKEQILELDSIRQGLRQYSDLVAFATPVSSQLLQLVYGAIRMLAAKNTTLIRRVIWYGFVGVAGAYIAHACEKDLLQNLITTYSTYLAKQETKVDIDLRRRIGTEGVATVDDLFTNCGGPTQPHKGRKPETSFTYMGVALGGVGMGLENHNYFSQPRSSQNSIWHDDDVLAHPSLNQGLRSSSSIDERSFSTTDGSNVTSIFALPPIREAIPTSILNDPFLFCFRLTNLSCSIRATNPAVLRAAYYSLGNKKKNVTSSQLQTFLVSILGVSQTLARRPWREQSAHERLFFISQFNRVVDGGPVRRLCRTTVPNIVYSNLSGEVSCFDLAHYLRGLLSLLPCPMCTDADEQEPWLPNLPPPADIFRELYHTAFASPHELLLHTGTSTFARFYGLVEKQQVSILKLAMGLSDKRAQRRTPFLLLREVSMAGAVRIPSPGVAQQVIEAARILLTQRLRRSLETKHVSARGECFDTGLYEALDIGLNRLGQIYRPRKLKDRNFDTLLYLTSIFVTFKQRLRPLLGSLTTRCSLSGAWLGNGIPPLDELLSVQNFELEHELIMGNLALLREESLNVVLPQLQGLMTQKEPKLINHIPGPEDSGDDIV